MIKLLKDFIVLVQKHINRIDNRIDNLETKVTNRLDILYQNDLKIAENVDFLSQKLEIKPEFKRDAKGRFVK